MNTYKIKAERIVKISKNLEKRMLNNKINSKLAIFQNNRLLRILSKI